MAEIDKPDMSDVEIGTDLDIEIVVDENDVVIGAVTDQITVMTSPDGSVVDEVIDVLDADGDLVMEDEKITVYDEDAQVVASSETIVLPIEE